MKPGGTLVFVDPLANRAHRSGPAALMEWLMTLARTTLGTRPSSSFSTVKGWLEQVGLGSVRSYLLIPLGATMITARKT